MAMDAFVPLTTGGGRGNDGAGAKPSGRTAWPARPMPRAVVRMATEVAAQPVRWLWKDQLARGRALTMNGLSYLGALGCLASWRVNFLRACLELYLGCGHSSRCALGPR